MKLFDSIGLVLKSKDENRVLSVAPDQSVYEAIAKMAEHGIGALHRAPTRIEIAD